MQIEDLISQFSKESPEEQEALIRDIRKRKREERPKAQAAKQKRSAKKVSTSKDKLKTLLASLPDEQRKELLERLQNGTNES